MTAGKWPSDTNITNRESGQMVGRLPLSFLTQGQSLSDTLAILSNKIAKLNFEAVTPSLGMLFSQYTGSLATCVRRSVSRGRRCVHPRTANNSILVVTSINFLREWGSHTHWLIKWTMLASTVYDTAVIALA